MHIVWSLYRKFWKTEETSQSWGLRLDKALTTTENRMSGVRSKHTWFMVSLTPAFFSKATDLSNKNSIFYFIYIITAVFNGCFLNFKTVSITVKTHYHIRFEGAVQGSDTYVTYEVTPQLSVPPCVPRMVITILSTVLFPVLRSNHFLKLGQCYTFIIIGSWYIWCFFFFNRLGFILFFKIPSCATFVRELEPAAQRHTDKHTFSLKKKKKER